MSQRASSLPRRWWIVAALAVVAVVAWAGSRTFASGDEIAWTGVTRGDLALGVAVEGTLASRDSSLLTPPPIAGMFDFQIRFMAPEGSLVEEGAPVVGFDTAVQDRRLLQLQTEAEQAAKNIEKLDADQRQQLMGLEMQLAEAEAALRKARLTADVPEDLRAANEAAVAALDVQIAETEVESLQGQLDAARASGEARRAALVAQRRRAEQLVGETRAAIEQMTVKAPRAGTVIYVTNWRGDKKKVGESAWRRERIIELPDLTRMLARGEVDEADAGTIAEGQPVTLRLDAHPDNVYRGTIESIWRTVRRKSNSRNPLKVVRLEIALQDTDVDRMRPGMRFRGEIETGRFENVVQVPVHAVFPTDAGPVVYRQSLFGYETVPVRLGSRNEQHVHVIEGVEPGDLVAETEPAS